MPSAGDRRLDSDIPTVLTVGNRRLDTGTYNRRFDTGIPTTEDRRAGHRRLDTGNPTTGDRRLDTDNNPIVLRAGDHRLDTDRSAYSREPQSWGPQVGYKTRPSTSHTTFSPADRTSGLDCRPQTQMDPQPISPP